MVAERGIGLFVGHNGHLSTEQALQKLSMPCHELGRNRKTLEGVESFLEKHGVYLQAPLPTERLGITSMHSSSGMEYLVDFHHGVTDTNGHPILIYRADGRKGNITSTYHYHPDGSPPVFEDYYVKQGTMQLKIGRVNHILGIGQHVRVEPLVPHQVASIPGQEAIVVIRMLNAQGVHPLHIPVE